MDYRVVNLIDNIYQVIDAVLNDGDSLTVYFQGSLADCEAWIRLTEQGYM